MSNLKHSSSSLFADDTAIYFSSKSLDTLQINLNGLRLGNFSPSQ